MQQGTTVDKVGLMEGKQQSALRSVWSSLEDALNQLPFSIPFPGSEIREVGVSKAQEPRGEKTPLCEFWRAEATT